MSDELLDSRLDVAHNRQALEGLMFGCTRLMEVAASVLVRIQPTSEKLTLSREIWVLAQAAQLIAQRIPGMRAADAVRRPANRGYARFTNHIVSLQHPGTELAALVHFAYRDLRDAVFAHRSRVPAADEASVDLLTNVLQKFDSLRMAGPPAPHCLSPLAAALRACGGVLGGVAEGSQEEHWDESELLSALPAIPIRPGRERDSQEASPGTSFKGDGYGPMLHDIAFRIELCATEICASMLAHHRDAPWGLCHDLAKQTRDEARHFELFMERAEKLGVQSGSWPVQFEVWDKFILGRDLPERIIIEQRIGEGAALDGADAIQRRMRADGEHELALVFEYITADEVTHVAQGNKWLRALLGSDDAVARVEEEVRQRLDEHGMPVRHHHPINVADRTLSGFTTEELERMRQKWER